uniref:Oxysterol-binding protein n=1 Tax=Salmo trutta TaxID=8032 RepID=A0A674CR91_SALTR
MDSFQNPYGSKLNRSQSLMSGLEKTPPTLNKPTHSRSSSTASSRHSRNIKDWEVMDDLQVEMSGDNSQDLTIPGICEGYLLKRRKWPLKGWHKVTLFILKITRGKLHGSLDVGLAVMSINKKSNRIDLDAGDILYHMKANSHDLFYIWVAKLSAHRMFKKNEAAQVHNGFFQALSQGTSVPGLAQRNGMQDMAAPAPSEFPSVNPGVNGKVSAWLQQTHDPDSCAQELNRCQLELSELNRLVRRLQLLEGGQQAFTDGELQRIISMQNLSLEKPKKSRSCKIWGHSRTMSRVEALGMLSSSHLNSSSQLGASVPSLQDYVPAVPDYVYSQLSPPTNASPEGMKIQQDICSVSQRVHASLKSVHDALAQERQRLQDTYHQSTTLAECLWVLFLTDSVFLAVFLMTVSGNESRRTPSVTDSAAEYFDASDGVLNGSFSESESGLSEGTTSNSEPEEGHASATREYRASISKTPNCVVPKNTGRRTTLAAHCPDNAQVGLMQILYNNIGKDLSRVSMPAALNEPINLMQRLCEELEYSELLDTANNTQDPYQRMVYIGAFAISGYATAHYRNRYKPFNPLLGETYECLREDKGFRYISEQVCHHPPISACHADSDSFSFWQDQRWKNKFWGKSLEIMPTGMVNVTLPRFGDHYEWNKVVTCIHNVLSQQRYLEHYGEVIIRNLNSNACTCKITFVKSRYWGSDTNKNEVQGTVLDQTGSVIHRFGGLWHEGIFCDTLPTPQCIWKPNSQPKDYYLYYGFSSFTLELNELTPGLKPLLPPTDSRLRPDQRMLEDGRVDDCDKFKEEVEAMQRERRKQLVKKGREHTPRFFKKAMDSAGRDVWLSNGTYWKVREDPGFANTNNLELW